MFCLVFSRNRKKKIRLKVILFANYLLILLLCTYTTQGTLIQAGEIEVTDPSAHELVEEINSQQGWYVDSAELGA